MQGTTGAGAFLTGVAELVRLAQVLGLLQGPGRERAPIEPWIKERIESLVRERGEARGQRDFVRADRLRAELARMGVLLEDTPHGTIWRLSS
jgi:cysteinyl-tRNA synthetase